VRLVGYLKRKRKDGVLVEATCACSCLESYTCYRGGDVICNKR